jgi:DNA-binding response OmpR family regulator
MTDRARPTVLVVEDEESVRAPLAKFLEMRRFEVVCVDTADEALEAIVTHRPVAAIVDLRLRRGSGREVVVAMPPGLPVIIFSGYPDQTCDLDTIRPNTRLVTKPYSLALLVQVLEEMLAGRADRGSTSGAPGP